MLMRVIISSSFLFSFFCYSFILVFFFFLCVLLFVSLLITFSFMFCGASIIPEPSFHCWACDRNTICRLLYDIDLHRCWEMMRLVGILWYLVNTICFSVEGHVCDCGWCANCSLLFSVVEISLATILILFMLS